MGGEKNLFPLLPSKFPCQTPSKLCHYVRLCVSYKPWKFDKGLSASFFSLAHLKIWDSCVSHTCEYPRNGVNSWYSSHIVQVNYDDIGCTTWLSCRVVYWCLLVGYKFLVAATSIINGSKLVSAVSEVPSWQHACLSVCLSVSLSLQVLLTVPDKKTAIMASTQMALSRWLFMPTCPVHGRVLVWPGLSYSRDVLRTAGTLLIDVKWMFGRGHFPGILDLETGVKGQAHLTTRRPAPTTLFHVRGRNLATELSLWPGQSCGTVCQRQFVTQTVYTLLNADSNCTFFSMCFNDWQCNALQVRFRVCRALNSRFCYILFYLKIVINSAQMAVVLVVELFWRREPRVSEDHKNWQLCQQSTVNLLLMIINKDSEQNGFGRKTDRITEFSILDGKQENG